MVDAASVEGRDPVADIKAINEELRLFNEDLLKKPQIIAANKIDAITDASMSDVLNELKAEFEPQGIKVMPISAVAGTGLKELLGEVKTLLDSTVKETVVFESEITPTMHAFDTEPFTVVIDPDNGDYVVEGPRIEKMLGYTNLESEKGFLFFQKFLREQGILKQLEDMGIQDGDTVRMYSLSFDYYK